jgi:hypothetical protein
MAGIQGTSRTCGIACTCGSVGCPFGLAFVTINNMPLNMYVN